MIVNASADEFYKQPMHYNLGHFRYVFTTLQYPWYGNALEINILSKFLRPGSVRIKHTLLPVQKAKHSNNYRSDGEGEDNEASDEYQNTTDEYRSGAANSAADGLSATAALDARRARVVLVLLNRNAQRDYRVTVRTPAAMLGDNKRRTVTVDIGRSSIATLVMPWGESDV